MKTLIPTAPDGTLKVDRPRGQSVVVTVLDTDDAKAWLAELRQALDTEKAEDSYRRWPMEDPRQASLSVLDELVTALESKMPVTIWTVYGKVSEKHPDTPLQDLFDQVLNRVLG